MRRVVLCLLPLLLPAPARLVAGTPAFAVEVSVWNVTGSSISLASGMRVDALFFRKGADGNPLSMHEPLLVLRNVEVDCGSPAANHGGRNPNVTSLVLTPAQAQAVRRLPAAVVQLVVVRIPKDARKAPHSPAGSAPPRAATRRRNTGRVYTYDAPPVSETFAEDRYASRGPSKGVLGIVRYLIWPAVGFLVLKIFAGTIRGTRRCRTSLKRTIQY